MVRPHRAFPFLADAARGNKNHWRVLGIHVCLRRRKHEIHPAVFSEFCVLIERAWITREVLRRAELQWIHEHAHHDNFGYAFGFIDERKMPFMEGTHCRNESDALALTT